MAETVHAYLTSNGEKIDGESTMGQTETASDNDRIDGGSGNDTLFREADIDSFAFTSDESHLEGENGNDLIVINEGAEDAETGALDAATGFETLNSDADAGGGPHVRIFSGADFGQPDVGDDIAPVIVRIVGDSGADGML